MLKNACCTIPRTWVRILAIWDQLWEIWHPFLASCTCTHKWNKFNTIEKMGFLWRWVLWCCLCLVWGVRIMFLREEEWSEGWQAADLSKPLYQGLCRGSYCQWRDSKVISEDSWRCLAWVGILSQSVWTYIGKSLSSCSDSQESLLVIIFALHILETWLLCLRLKQPVTFISAVSVVNGIGPLVYYPLDLHAVWHGQPL